MKKLICSACVAVLASLVSYDVHSMMLSTLEQTVDVKRPVSEFIAKDFATRCLGKPVTKIPEIKEWEYNLDNGISGAPQLFRAESESIIVRTGVVNSKEEMVEDEFNDIRMQLIVDTQKKLDIAKSSVVLAYPFRFGAFNSTKGLRLLNSPSMTEKGEVQLQLTPEVNGEQLSELLENNSKKIKQSMCNDQKIDQQIVESSYNAGVLVGKGIANLHKLGTVHGDARPQNVFVNLDNGIITFIDLCRMGGNYTVGGDLATLLGFDWKRYEISNMPYVTGFLNGYKSIFVETPISKISWIDDDAGNTTQYLIHNLFYRNFLGGKASFYSSYSGNYSKNIEFKNTDIELFNRAAAAMGLLGENVKLDKFAEVMKIIDLEMLREYKDMMIRQAPVGFDFRKELEAVIQK